jgi:alkylation response protein AidB-like acyl-CoA dehydrogenase
MDHSLTQAQQEIREAVLKVCARFGDDYWLERDREGGFPQEFHRAFAEAGGLASYGASVVEAYRQAGVYVARILKGDKPGELPVMQAAKYEFVLNLKAARALGIDVPMAFSAAADEIIE